MTEKQLEIETLGYVEYKQRISSSRYPKITLLNIIEHRNAVLRKYNGSENKYVDRIIGMGQAEGIFIPVDYDGVIIDADDVFAAVYAMDYNLGTEKNRSENYVLWILFTNDIYMPVLPMVYVQSVSFFDRLTKQKKNDYIPVIEKCCHNLKYPICNLKYFEELVRAEHSIRGKIDKAFLLEQVYDATNQFGLFDSETITYEIGCRTRELLSENGYVIS